MKLISLGRRTSVLLLAGVAFSGTANAADQGTLGATSTGKVLITAQVPQQVRISGLSDITFNPTDVSTAVKDAQNVCVWSNSATRGYNIKASGDGASSAFTIKSGTLPVIPYAVEWKDASGATSGSTLDTTVALAGQKSLAKKSDCTDLSAESASLIVKIAATDLQAMEASASYTGTLTLTVAPE
jgi:hypothetical protein